MNSKAAAMDSLSPSFNTYFNTNLAEVVARVTADFRNEIRNENEDEFEFNLLAPGDGEIRHVYPVFLRDLRPEFDLGHSQIQHKDGDADSPSSSSEEGELEKISDGTYCVWNTKNSPSPSPGRCGKSNSTGSSPVKAWKKKEKDGVCSAAGRAVKKTSASMIGLSKAAVPDKNKRRSYLPYRQNLLSFSVHLLPYR